MDSELLKLIDDCYAKTIEEKRLWIRHLEQLWWDDPDQDDETKTRLEHESLREWGRSYAEFGNAWDALRAYAERDNGE